MYTTLGLTRAATLANASLSSSSRARAAGVAGAVRWMVSATIGVACNKLGRSVIATALAAATVSAATTGSVPRPLRQVRFMVLLLSSCVLDVSAAQGAGTRAPPIGEVDARQRLGAAG